LTRSLTRFKIAGVSGFTPDSLESLVMAYVIAEPCIGTMDRGCVDVCPVDCIYEGEDQLYYPEEDVPEEWHSFIEKNRQYFETGEERQVAQGRGG
jgi:NAD-dependent dihydropyrimidine dehydrogenase PreA subunit